MTSTSRRRAFLTGAVAAVFVPSVATGADPARAEGAGTEQAGPDGIDYSSRDAFDVAEDSYLAVGAEDNEAGQYAWGTAYYLESLLWMYEAYGDPSYLDRFEDEADRVLSRTDERRGVADHQGRSGPVWRAGGNYAASHAALPDADGRPAVQIRWAGVQPAKSGGGTAADSMVAGTTRASERSVQSRASAKATSKNTFDLTLTNPSADPLTLEDLSLDPSDDGYVVDRINDAYDQNRRWTAKELRRHPGRAPAPDVDLAFEQQYFVFPVHTGMMVAPLAAYARLTHEHGLRARYRTARRCLRAAERAVGFHDAEFAFHDDGSGDYVYPKGAPIAFDGLIAPYNMSHAMGRAFVELSAVTRKHVYLAKVRAMLQSFRRGLALDVHGAYTWTYWPPHSEAYQGYSAGDGYSEYMPSYLPYQNPEDISHGAISLGFVQAAFAAGLDDRLESDLEHFARTYTERVARTGDTVANNVDGSGKAPDGVSSQCARWVPLAIEDPDVASHARAVYDALGLDLQQGQGSEALGVAFLNWARESGHS